MRTVPDLTEQEEIIVEYLAKSKSAHAIAHEIGIDKNIVESCVQSILRKFSAKTLEEGMSEIKNYSEWFTHFKHDYFANSIETLIYILPNRTGSILSRKVNFEVMADKFEQYRINMVTDGVCDWVKFDGEHGDMLQNVGGFVEYRHKFDQPYLKGETGTVHIEAKFSDDCLYPDDGHFVSVMVPTGKLTMGVVFHSRDIPKKVYFQRRLSKGNAQPLDIPVDIENEKYSLIIQEPIYRGNYHVRWRW